MASRGRDYGRDGRVGVGTPQANPTVEPEFAAMLGPRVALYTMRLTSESKESRVRLIEYIELLPRQLHALDSLPLDVFGFACTGSSYLIGVQREADLIRDLEQARRHKIVTAGMAVRSALDELGAGRIAVVTPYPDWLTQASMRYWDSSGHRVVATSKIEIGTDDTRAIYELSSDQAVDAAKRLDVSNADAVFLAGTGMPTLKGIAEIERVTGRPTLSSNLCLGWAMLRHIGRLPAASNRKFYWGWEDRLDAL
jgi:maleate isomerase